MGLGTEEFSKEEIQKTDKHLGNSHDPYPSEKGR